MGTARPLPVTALPDDPFGAPLQASGLPGASVLKRVGSRIGLRTVRDLLLWLPRRYDDLRILHDLHALRFLEPDTIVSARATVVRVRAGRTARRGIRVVTADLADGTGTAEAQWYGRQYVERRLHEGDELLFSGKLKKRGASVLLDNPAFQPPEGDLVHVGRIVPVYRLTAGLPIRTLRAAMRAALDRLPPYEEYLGAPIRDELGLVGIGEALAQVHFPDTFAHRDAALRRLAFDELLALQVGMVGRRRERAVAASVSIDSAAARDAEIRRELAAALGRRLGREVELTDDQDRAMDVIRDDVRGPHPMLRLLQGDVGSGKTVVAAYALALAVGAGVQGALLAPTDLLARQHAATLDDLLRPLGIAVELLTGSLAGAESRRVLEAMADGRADVVVGTHALFSEKVSYARLGLVVVDEQHRFGVEQRGALEAKTRAGAAHVLLMTATPIPRTIGQVLYADLDVTDLRTVPTGRLPIRTGLRHPDHLERLWTFVVREAAAGRQTFVVVPHIDEADETEEAPDDVAGAEAEVVRLRALLNDPARLEAAGLDRELVVELVHGRLRPADRDAAMARFRDGAADVLVGTTIVEVGVDIPAASVMVIEGADRFGLAQLHQLRGRVGRASDQGWCVLVSDQLPADERRAAALERGEIEPDGPEQVRLAAVARLNDGFALAEVDFEQRREGDVLGYVQHGLPRLRVATLTKPEHRELAVAARRHAEALVLAGGGLGAAGAMFAAELDHGWLRDVAAGEPATGA
ncbi:MAG TPA: ATP-dependent DNA helicase RecG [Candidatus Limnocylindrales bacterium]